MANWVKGRWNKEQLCFDAIASDNKVITGWKVDGTRKVNVLMPLPLITGSQAKWVKGGFKKENQCSGAIASDARQCKYKFTLVFCCWCCCHYFRLQIQHSLVVVEMSDLAQNRMKLKHETSCDEEPEPKPLCSEFDLLSCSLVPVVLPESKCFLLWTRVVMDGWTVVQRS